MKTPLTPEIRTKANEMFYRGQTRHSISEALGLTLGQVSALAAHRMMRNRKTLSARAQLLSLIQPTGDNQPRTNADSIIHMGSGLDGASVTRACKVVGRLCCDRAFGWSQDGSKASVPMAECIFEGSIQYADANV
jgi:hypothetical protein